MTPPPPVYIPLLGVILIYLWGDGSSAHPSHKNQIQRKLKFYPIAHPISFILQWRYYGSQRAMRKSFILCKEEEDWIILLKVTVHIHKLYSNALFLINNFFAHFSVGRREKFFFFYSFTLKNKYFPLDYCAVLCTYHKSFNTYFSAVHWKSIKSKFSGIPTFTMLQNKLV